MFEVKLSEDQRAAIERLAAPLQRGDRQRYWRRVRELLSAHAEIGDGLVSRIGAQAQREVMRTPPPTVAQFAEVVEGDACSPSMTARWRASRLPRRRSHRLGGLCT
jgi:hypothetical protein